ncbi:MAG: gliding motility-associated C-terminal domain-containing protein, partial [Bacteroidia bacterium]
TLLCPGEKLLLNAFVEGATYFWNDSTTTGFKEISSPGKYWVELAQGQCKFADTIHVYYNDSPRVNLGKDTTFCGLNFWQLDAGKNNNPDAEYEWNTGQKSQKIIVSEPGDYWVRASFCGVTASDTISLGFINYKPEDLLMPNAFSPNDDKLNDTLRAVGIDLMDAFEWRIYNRWGQLIYKTNDITKGWDGKYNGLPSPAGLYHWKLTLRSACLKDDELSRSGIVYLVR